MRADNRPRCTERRSPGQRGKKAFVGHAIAFLQHAIAVEARAASRGVPLAYYYIDSSFLVIVNMFHDTGPRVPFHKDCYTGLMLGCYDKFALNQ